MTKCSKMNNSRQTFKYVFFDWLSALVAWIAFFCFRKYNDDPTFFDHYNDILADKNFWIGITCIPVGWVEDCCYLQHFMNIKRNNLHISSYKR